MRSTRIGGFGSRLTWDLLRLAALALVALGPAALAGAAPRGPLAPMAPTTLTLSAGSPNPSSFGQSVSWSYTIGTGGACVTPTGTVSLKEGSTTYATVAVPSPLVYSGLSTGGHTLFATYSGDANCDPSSSGSVAHTVNKAATSISLVSSQNPSVYGQSVTFTATVAPAVTGTVTFDDGSTVLATRTLDGSGQASFTTTTLEVGTHPMRAVYHGNTNYNGSNSSVLNQVVNKASTALTLTRSPAASTVYGQFVTFSAALTAVSPGAGTPTGVVLFQDAGSTIGIGFVNGAGVASFATASLPVGSHAMTAVYGGDAGFNGVTSGTLTHTVNKADTAVALSQSTDVPFPVNPSRYGQNLILTAVVTAVAPGGGVPAGQVIFRDGANTLGIADLNLDGQAVFQTRLLEVGGHSLTAEYTGSPSHNGVTSSALSHTVNKADTTVVVIDPPNASAYKFGQAFLLKAHVSIVAPGSGVATGEVRFKFVNSSAVTLNFGGQPYVAAPLDPSGNAQTVIPQQEFPYADTYSVTAIYVGDSHFNASPTSPVNTLTIEPAFTQVDLSSSRHPSVYGQAITFGATVSVVQPGSMIPATTDPNRVTTGPVTIYLTPTVGSPSTLSGNLTLTPGQPFNGNIQIPAGSLPVGTYSVQARYQPGSNPNFKQHFSQVITQTINPGETTTKLSSSVNPSLSGQNTTLTATISVTPPAAGTPTGTVTFKSGGLPIAGCTAVALVGLQATCVTSFGTGVYTLTAEYSGDGNFDPSTSGGLTQTVTTAPTTVTLADISVPLVTTFGQTASFQATVTAPPGTGTPAGAVEFRRAGVTIAGCGAVVLAAGLATCNTTSLPAGDNPITAVFTPTSDHGGGASAVIFHTVLRAPTTTTLTRLPNTSSVYGQPVQFSATVSSGFGSPSGTVVFKSDGVKFAEQPLSGGSASFTIATLPVGAHSITAVYLGDANFDTSTGTLAHSVLAASTTTVVVSAVNPSVFGQLVGFTATVTVVAPGTGTPTGTVTFKDGASTIGTGTLNAAGQASFATAALSVGPHAISAVYAGDGNYATSTGNLPTQVVNPAATTTTVTGAPSPSILGSPVTFTAVVTANPPGSGTPGGTITFRDGATNIAGCVGVAMAGGQASCVTSALALGGHTIWADYSGSASFSASSGSMSHLVSNTPVDLAVAKRATPNPVLAGSDLTYTITVTNKTALATSATLTDPLPGQVTFVSVSPPGGWACTDPGVGSTGTVTCTTAVIPANASVVFSLVVHVPLDTPAGTILANTASVSGGLPDPDLSNNQSTNETTVYRTRRP